MISARTTLQLSLAISVSVAVAACGSSSHNGSSGSGGKQQLANTYTTSDQQRPAVAADGHGRAVVAWESLGQDGSHLGVFAQRFVDGVPAGPEFQVNSYTVSRQNFPAVAMDGAGNFVIAWRSSLQGSPGGTIFAQRYTADGAKLGGEFQVGPDNSARDSQSEPQVAMNARGDFVIAWSNREVGAVAEALGQNNLEDRWLEVRAYAPDGTPRIDPMRTTIIATDQYPRAPRVAMDADGNFVLVWASAGDATQLRAQHFDLNATALSPAYTVNEVAEGVDVDLATVAMNPDGQFAVAWEGHTYGYEPLGLYLQRYSGPQTPVGSPIVVAPPSTGLIERNAMTLTPTGAVLLAAQGDGQVRIGVQTEAGGALRSVARVGGNQAMFPAVALTGERQAIVAWQVLSEGANGRDIQVGEFSLP